MFVDKVKVSFKAGDGGDGALSFRHEKFIDRGGPDGGDGGHGGNIVLVASRNQNTLVAFRYKKNLSASNGQPGGKRKKHGKNGEDLEVIVPVGTVITDEDGSQLADMSEDNQRHIILKGGSGGFGNAHFVSSTRQAPRIVEKGEKGQSAHLILEMKMIADVGLVGLPNAGKSTLLSVVSNAKPEIANYPFTTLHPNLGVVDIDKKHSLLFADVPGLISGASKGKGLGDEFLRHLERTSVLIHLIDVYNDDIAKAYKTIMDELKAYRVDLSKRPQIIALTKSENFDEKQLKKLTAKINKLAPSGTKIIAISSVSKIGLDELLREANKLVGKIRAKEAKVAAKQLPVIGLKEDDDLWQIQKLSNGKFVVTGRRLEKFASRTDFSDYHALSRLRDIMKKMGILRELERQGIESGQKIEIGHPVIGHLEY